MFASIRNFALKFFFLTLQKLSSTTYVKKCVLVLSSISFIKTLESFCNEGHNFNIFKFFLSPHCVLAPKKNFFFASSVDQLNSSVQQIPTWTTFLTNQIRPLKKAVIQLLSLQKKQQHVFGIPLSHLHLNFNYKNESQPARQPEIGPFLVNIR